MQYDKPCANSRVVPVVGCLRELFQHHGVVGDSGWRWEDGEVASSRSEIGTEKAAAYVTLTSWENNSSEP